MIYPRITVKLQSGYGPVTYVGKQRITASPNGISYKNIPYMPSKLNPECSWWISIRSEKYTRLYSNLCKVLDRILAEEYWFIEDAGEAEFSVKTSDGKTIHKEISCGHDDVQKFFSTLKRMLPKDVTVL